MYTKVIQKTLRVPRREGPAGDGSAVARQLDAVLLSVGFSATRELLTHVAELAPGNAMDIAVHTVKAVRELVGDQVVHNSYFINFPHGVPDTVAFWSESLRSALLPVGAGTLTVFEDEALRGVVASGALNLLTLPNYGRYQHTFGDLLAVHDELIESRKDRITVLHLGDTLEEEVTRLYLQLASSTVPLNEADLELLRELAPAMDVQPTSVPIRENRAVINVVRLERGLSLVAVDTVTDVLRVAALASEADVSLATAPRFRNFARSERRLLLAALHNVVSADDSKLADVRRFAEQWKRLSKALHPADYLQYSGATAVFGVARGDLRFPSIASSAEAAFRAEDYVRAARALSAAPGLLLRSVDRLLRGASVKDQEEIVELIKVALKSASGRVLLSLREHLMNRGSKDVARVFVGRTKRAWVTPDNRARLDITLRAPVVEAIDNELIERMPASEHLVVDPAVFDMALPLSGKASESGFAVLPRGSRTTITPAAGDSVCFFTYWKESARRTDFDLSLLMLDHDFLSVGQVSWTNYHGDGVTYSGDIVESHNGATEFIDVQLDKVDANVKCLVPQVNIYCGESFDEVSESMFGWMLRDRANHGMPFEPRTVRTRSDMRGAGTVALPVMLVRNEDNSWSAVWTHLYLSGFAAFNRVEENKFSTALLARGIVEREYLGMEYLAVLLQHRATETAELWTPGMKFGDGVVTFVGREVPEGLPEGSEIFAGDRLTELIPG